MSIVFIDRINTMTDRTLEREIAEAKSRKFEDLVETLLKRGQMEAEEGGSIPRTRNEIRNALNAFAAHEGINVRSNDNTVVAYQPIDGSVWESIQT